MKVSLIVPDMTCEHCIKTLDGAIRALPDISNVSFDLDKKMVVVEGNFEVPDVVAAIKGAGYSVDQILNIQV